LLCSGVSCPGNQQHESDNYQSHFSSPF